MGNSASSPAPPSEFNISGKKLKLDSAKDVEEFVAKLKKLKQLEKIVLNGNTLGIDASKALAEAFAKHPYITEVDLSDCFTGRLKEEVPVSLKAFGDVFINKPKLIKIDFSDNAFGPIGAKALVTFLEGCWSLEELRLNNNGLGPEGGRIIAEALIKCQEANKLAGRSSSLRRIVIGRNRLENGSAPYMANAIEAHNLLEQVSLPQNGIRPEGIEILASALAKCRNLVLVDLQDNTFTNSASIAFAGSIQAWPKLENLNIGDCLLGSIGAISILKSLVALANNTPLSLKHLNLQYDEMDEQAAMYLANNINAFKNLKSLLLNGNAFNPSGQAAAAIRAALKTSSMDNVVDSWSDMDYESEESEGESEESEESEEEEVEEEVETKVGEEEMEQVKEVKEVEEVERVDGEKIAVEMDNMAVKETIEQQNEIQEIESEHEEMQAMENEKVESETDSTEEINETESTEKISETDSTKEMNETDSTKEMNETGSTKEINTVAANQEQESILSLTDSESASKDELNDTIDEISGKVRNLEIVAKDNSSDKFVETPSDHPDTRSETSNE